MKQSAKDRLNSFAGRIGLNANVEEALKRRDPPEYSSFPNPSAMGEIFSSELITEIKRDLASSYSTQRGQIIDNEGGMSKEMDIIIFKGKPYQEWTMGYVFVPKSNVKAVFECKTKTASYKYQNDLRKLKYFSPLCYLFMQYYDGKRFESYRRKLINAGFDDAFTIYKLKEPHGYELEEESWLRF